MAEPGAHPSARNGHALAYDSERKELFLFSGQDNEYLGDTWRQRLDPDRTPSFTGSVDLSAGGFDSSEVQRIHIRAYAGGQFSPFDEGAIGTTLYGWRAGGVDGETGEGLPPGFWVALDANQAGFLALESGEVMLLDTQDGALDWAIESEESIGEFFQSNRVNFQIRPSGVAGTQAAGEEPALAVDYVEVRVDYRLSP